jgi:hypothetical protein
MIEKLAFIPEVDEFGFERVVPFGTHGNGLEKVASLPDGVQKYADKFKPEHGELGLLITAMGGLECWGPNSNSDGFTKSSLLHLPSDWADEPEHDRTVSAGWAWGIPTFYGAKLFAHHRNKKDDQSVGDVGYVAWDPKMQWVLLAVLIDPERAKKRGGDWMLDRVGQGRPIPFSMGCRVPFDVLSTSSDWGEYEKALATYDPAKHKLPADAILHYHDHIKHIYGLSRTRKDYTDEMLFHANEVRRDGRKIYVENPYPFFFDISAVGVPADQTAWAMMKLGSRCAITGTKCAGQCGAGTCQQYTLPGAILEERFDMLMDKAASLHTASLGKGAVVRKGADIEKQVSPQMQQQTPLKDDEPELPKGLLDRMGDKPLSHSLSTPTCMGMLLKPREFRRVVLIRMGKKGLADKLDHEGADLPASIDEESPGTMGIDAFDDDLAKMLEPMLGERSWLGPMAVKKIHITIMRGGPSGDEPEVQRKVAALYNGYRKQASALIERAPVVLSRRPSLRASVYGFGDLTKHGGIQINGSLTPLVTSKTRDYFRAAYV